MMVKSDHVINFKLIDRARSWILSNVNEPHADLEPEFNIDSNELINAEKIRNLSTFDPLFWEKWLAESRLLEVVSNSFIDPVIVRHAAFLKYQNTSKQTPVHQDGHLWGRSFRSARTYWIALTEAYSQNGGLYFVKSPGEILPHEYSLEHPGFKVINKSLLSSFMIESMNLDKGEIAIWDGSTPHGSFLNECSGVRIGMPIVFAEKRDIIMNKWLRETLSLILGRDVSDGQIEISFDELKGQSLRVVTLLSRFSKEYGCCPDIPDFVRQPSIEKLEEVLIKKHGDKC